jgi:hypothetical protein
MFHGFYFRDKAHLIKMIKMHCGVYSIKLPFSDKELFEDIILGDTLGTFSEYYPKLYPLPCELNQLRVKNARDSTSSDYSDIYEFPNIEAFNGGNRILGIRKITPYNDLRYEATTQSYETIESYQALALAQGVANLSSVMEAPMFFEYLGGRRFRVTNGTYYKNRVVIYINMSYNEELFDIPEGLRLSFAALAELDIRRNIFNNLKYWEEMQTAVGSYRLRIEDFQNAEDQRNELLDHWTESHHLEAGSIIIF